MFLVPFILAVTLYTLPPDLFTDSEYNQLQSQPTAMELYQYTDTLKRRPLHPSLYTQILPYASINLETLYQVERYYFKATSMKVNDCIWILAVNNMLFRDAVSHPGSPLPDSVHDYFLFTTLPVDILSYKDPPVPFMQGTDLYEGDKLDGEKYLRDFGHEDVPDWIRYKNKNGPILFVRPSIPTQALIPQDLGQRSNRDDFRRHGAGEGPLYNNELDDERFHTDWETTYDRWSLLDSYNMLIGYFNSYSYKWGYLFPEGIEEIQHMYAYTYGISYLKSKFIRGEVIYTSKHFPRLASRIEGCNPPKYGVNYTPIFDEIIQILREDPRANRDVLLMYSSLYTTTRRYEGGW